MSTDPMYCSLTLPLSRWGDVPRSSSVKRSAISHPTLSNDGPAFEVLEARSLLSSYIYQDFGDLAGPPVPRVLAEGYRGPAVFVGDLDHDGVPDLLVGYQAAVT